MNVTDAMLTAAVRKAVEVKLLPRSAPGDVYLENWAKIEAVVYAALDALKSPRDCCPKGGSCAWKIDGQHANEYCGKCFRDRPKGE